MRSPASPSCATRARSARPSSSRPRRRRCSEQERQEGQQEEQEGQEEREQQHVGNEPTENPPKMKTKEYEAELRTLQGELVAMQEWVKASGAKVCIVFEGRDSAGKGGTIKAITDRVSPRVFRVVALPSPTEREKSQMYVQRYVPHLPGGGRGRDLRPQLVQPRRGRAGAGLLHRGRRRAIPRAGARRREGDGRFGDRASEVLARGRARTSRPAGCRAVSMTLARSGSCQTMDLKSYNRWYDYARARDAMFEATDTKWAPWHVARTDDKKRGRLNIITHLLSQIPYEPLKPKKVKFPDRQPARRLHRARSLVASDPDAVLSASAGLTWECRPEAIVAWRSCSRWRCSCSSSTPR